MDDALIDSLRRAVEAMPSDVGLRVHLAQLLIEMGRADEAVTQCAVALQHEPSSASAREMMTRAMQGVPPSSNAAHGEATTHPALPPRDATSGRSEEASGNGAASVAPNASSLGFDWDAAEHDLGSSVQPRFVAPPRSSNADASASMPGDDEVDDRRDAVSDDSLASDLGLDAWDVERPTITLKDVGGMQDVKDRLEMAFLAPMRNPEMRRMYGKSLKGGLLLYGPPGTGKTFVARAVAGELGAQFMSIGLTDILDQWIGNSERNLHNLFQQARANAPVVLFIDEIDAIGMKRSSTSMSSAMRNTINQLLVEMDGIAEVNEGVFVMGATNQPWDVDPALRRPGRLDRTVLVLPPDAPARAAIFRHHLAHRPIEGIDLGWLAEHSSGLTGADIAYVCERATENAMMASMRSGTARMIGMDDLRVALRDVRPSCGEWFATARNVVQYADADGSYADLRAYMKARKML